MQLGHGSLRIAFLIGACGVDQPMAALNEAHACTSLRSLQASANGSNRIVSACGEGRSFPPRKGRRRPGKGLGLFGTYVGVEFAAIASRH